MPRTLDDFTGRGADLAWLIEAANHPDPHAPVVLAVDGMPGVGKTSLAVRAAHLLKARFPDGQLFIDLQGHSEHRPVEPSAALDTLLRQLGVPATQIPAELDERTARWRSELAARRVLIVFDNAASSGQVAPLLPAGPGCLTLVTSRRRLVDLDGARPRSVETLDPTDAVALLGRIAGRRVADEPEAAAEVAKRCGCLPLALRLAAARLAHRPRWRVQDLADRLSDPSTPLAELTAGDRSVADAFALSYKQLASPSQRMFRLLGLHPGEHFDAYAAAALTDTQPDQAQRLLDGLVDSHLISEPHTNRYRLHDLLRAYASDLAVTIEASTDRNDAVQRLLDYYLHATAAACAPLEPATSRRSFQPGKPLQPDLVAEGRSQGIDWLDEERTTVVTVIHYAAAHRYHRYTWQLGRAIWRYLYLRGHVDDLISTHRLGLAAAEWLNDSAAVAAMHNYLASAYFLRGHYDAAIEHMQHTLAHRIRTGDRAGEAAARRNLTSIYGQGGNHHEAISECERALAAAAKSNDTSAVAYALVNASTVSLRLGRYEAALKRGRRALALAREVDDKQCLGMALGNVGFARAKLGQTRPALRLLQAAVRARRHAHDQWGVAEAINQLGAVCRLLGSFDQAVAYHQEALAIVREAGFRREECAVYNELGSTLLAAGDLNGAIQAHEQALNGATKMRDKYNKARALDGIAACLRVTDPEAAQRDWLSALRLYQEFDVPERHEVERQLAALALPVG